jgi:hypothetical protein
MLVGVSALRGSAWAADSRECYVMATHEPQHQLGPALIRSTRTSSVNQAIRCRPFACPGRPRVCVHTDAVCGPKHQLHSST